MKFKMAKNSIFAILLRAPWMVSAGIAALIALIAWAALPAKFAPYGILTSIPFWIVSAMAGWRQLRAPNKNYVAHRLQVFRAMPWQEFSAGVEQALLRDGFVVTRIDQSAANFSIVSGDRKGLVSCKRWKAPSNGAEPLRDLYQAMQASGGHECIYVTTGGFTQNAMQFAVDKKIRLLNDVALVKFLREMKSPPVQKKT